MIILGIEFKTEMEIVRFDESGYVDEESLKKAAKLKHLMTLRAQIQAAITDGNPDLVEGKWFMGDLSGYPGSQTRCGECGGINKHEGWCIPPDAPK